MTRSSSNSIGREWDLAVRLAEHVGSGGELPVLASPVLLDPSEVLHADLCADGWRLLALAVFSAIFLTLGAVAFVAARARLNQGSRLWGASLAELERDKERLRS